MNRTTIRLKPDLLKKAKQMAIEKDISLQQVVNWGIEILINQNNKPKKKDIKIKLWPTAKLGKKLDKLVLDKEFIYGPPRI